MGSEMCIRDRIGMKYLRNLPTAADGSIASFTVLIFSFILDSLWQSINFEFKHTPKLLHLKELELLVAAGAP